MRRKQKSVLWLSLTLSLIPLASISVTAQEALLLRYPFNEGVGDRVRDVSGNENNAIMHNMDDTSWVDGKEPRFVTCLALDGIDDYLTTDGFFSEPLDGDFTLSMWFTGTPGRRARLFQLRSGDLQMINVRILDNDTLEIDDHGGVQTGVSGNVTVTDQQWHHFAIVRSGMSLIAYLDGEQHMETSLQDVVAMDNVSIGVRDRTGTQDDYLPGKVDEFSIYAEALDIDKIRFLMEHLDFAVESASNPDPADKADDVSRDTNLAWSPGEFAVTHDVYIGTVFEYVNDASRTNPLGVLVSQNQAPNTYSPAERLQFSQTYYWRIDEVNAPPDNTIFKSDVWSFTTEPVGYAIENITATASSAHNADMGPENTVNGSGLDANDLHSMEAADMWLSSSEPLGAWIEFQFDKVYKLHEMRIWNSNQAIESLVGFGLKGVTIEHSTNGIDYMTLGTTHEFAQAPGAAGYAHNTTVDFGGAAAKYVKITASSNWGFLAQYGLSEVRFFYIPVWAREPSPDSGAAGVPPDVVLGWVAGREAVTHDVYISTDEQAVIDGTAPVAAVTETSYGPLSLDLGQSYYWKINEVNMAEAPTTWDGDVWNLTTPDFIVVDDFESYNDLDPDDPASKRIFNVWIDGFGVATNGSLVGYDAAPFCEQTIVHSGRQSMPLAYSNTGDAAYSEAELPLSPPQEWTKHGVATFVLHFHGAPGNTGQLYVKINDSKVVYDGDAADIAKPRWKQWNIELAPLGAGVQNVTKLSVGVDGGGAGGTLYVDDFRLYRLVPEPPLEIWIEAEAAESITEPMKIYDDPLASGGKYIGTDDGIGDQDDNPPPDGIATYSFTVEGGTYKILGRVRPDAGNSFFVRIATGTPVPVTRTDGWIRWNSIEAGAAWHWDEVHDEQQSGNPRVEWTLPAGQHTLEIARREDGGLLDLIVISKLD